MSNRGFVEWILQRHDEDIRDKTAGSVGVESKIKTTVENGVFESVDWYLVSKNRGDPPTAPAEPQVRLLTILYRADPAKFEDAVVTNHLGEPTPHYDAADQDALVNYLDEVFAHQKMTDTIKEWRK